MQYPTCIAIALLSNLRQAARSVPSRFSKVHLIHRSKRYAYLFFMGGRAVIFTADGEESRQVDLEKVELNFFLKRV